MDIENKNPFDVLKSWLVEAEKSEPNDPNAMALATVDKNGVPQNRMVLLKDIVGEDLVFYTNKDGQKARAMNDNQNVAVLFHWKSLRRQVRVTGTVSFVDKSENQKYFSSRATISQLGAIASKQSQPLNDKQTLIDDVKSLEEKYDDSHEIPCPDHWGGYKITATKIELWIDGENRLHDRFEFIKDSNDNWISTRLYP
ncbi:MAG: pyridoxamine 5'-phosphate oxidase [Alphaproteobacteria bacterium]